MLASTNERATAVVEEMTMTPMDGAAVSRPWSGSRGRMAAVAVAMLAALLLVMAGTARAADWGLTPGSFQVDLSTAQAGGHPDIRTRFSINTEPGEFLGTPSPMPVRNLRDLTVDLPPGLVGNPQNYPTCRPSEYPFCPTDTQVGTVKLYLSPAYAESSQIPVFNMEPPQGTVAQFAFSALSVLPIHLTASLRDGDHGLRLSLPQTPLIVPLLGVDMTFWGAPGSAVHNNERMLQCFTVGGSEFCNNLADLSGPMPVGGLKSSIGPRPFMINRAQCGVAGTAKLSMNTWEAVDEFRSYETEVAPVTGCEKQRFEPKVTLDPDSREAGAPTGLGVDVDIPQTNEWNATATPPLKQVVMKLPEGMTLSPSAADGLQSCSNEQVGLGSDGTRAACPKASEIGTVKIETPLLGEDMTGRIYVGSPTPDQLVRIFLVAEGGSVRLKLEGKIDPDPVTGQLTATFAGLPQLAASKVSLHFNGGPRAALSNPTSCGVHTANAAVTPWSSDEPVNANASFTIDQGCDTGAAFTPTMTAGTTNVLAGASAPFTLTVSKPAGQPRLQALDVTLPAGLLGRLTGVPQCGDEQATNGSCGAESRIGRTTVSVGAGASPLSVPQAGKAPTGVYLAGPYKGAPFSLSIVVPAQAGPYDLGTVVVRAALFIDPTDAHVTLKSDPLPTILKGFPLDIQRLNVTIDRTGFMLNPTSCTAGAVAGTLASTSGQTASTSSRFQVGGCADLGYAPKLDLKVSGELKNGGHPQLDATLLPKAGEANQKTAQVTLPLNLALDPQNAKALCEPAAAAGNSCPSDSIVGKASAVSILDVPLEGPVYFVRGERTTATGRVVGTLPKLFIPLSGQGVTINVHASSDVAGKKLQTTFDDLPDAPIERFDLKIDGGAHGILKVANGDVCKSTSTPKVGQRLVGQNGKVHQATSTLGTSCRFGVVKTARKGNRVSVTVAGLTGGKVTLSGSGITKSTRTVSASSTVASVGASLNAASRRALNRGRTVRLKVKVGFKPATKGAKTVTTTKSVVVKPAKKK